MLKHIIAISFVYLCAALAWVVLGAAMQFRTLDQDDKLRQSVEQIWGAPQVQTAPTAYWVEEDQQHSLALHSSRVDVDLALDHRRKGLLWYSTYRVKFAGDYIIENNTDEPRELLFDFALPAPEAVYDGFGLVVGERAIRPMPIDKGHLSQPFRLEPGERERFRVTYVSQGTGSLIRGQSRLRAAFYTVCGVALLVANLVTHFT